MEQHGEPEQLEGGVQQLSLLLLIVRRYRPVLDQRKYHTYQLDGVAEGDAEQGEVEDQEDGEDGEDVELVSGVVVVQVVPGLSIRQPELVPQSQSLAEMSHLQPPHDIRYQISIINLTTD